MVKFKLPGDGSASFRICGHFYTGGRVYDNDVINLPLEEIKPFIIGEKVEEKIAETPKVIKPRKTKRI